MTEAHIPASVHKRIVDEAIRQRNEALAENERLQRERDEAREELDKALTTSSTLELMAAALRAENERLKAAEIAGREILLPMKREQGQRLAQEVYSKAIEDAAAELEINWGHIATPEMRDAILALKDKP
jgi:hypothetical protein